MIIDENGGGGIEAELAASILVGLLKERKFTRIIAAVVRTRHGLSSRAGELRGSQGGLELPPKEAQARLGHSTLAMTMDRYGHLFPRRDDAAALNAAKLKLVG